MYRWSFMSLFVAFFMLSAAHASAASTETAIVTAATAKPLEQLAAKEVRRYVYQRTGALLPIMSESPKTGDIICIGKSPDNLAEDEYLLRTTTEAGRTQVRISGGSELSTLYAAYRFAEHLGVRFYLHGDVIPDNPIPFSIPTLDERRKPLFGLRGIQPFHDFAEGPDWWNLEDYKAIIGQLPKLGMNFIGLHTYPEDRPAAEPTVWIGFPENVAPDGRPHCSYPAIYYNTLLPVGWGYAPKATADYSFGAGTLYDRNDYGSDVMRHIGPTPQSPRDCNEVFNRAGALLHDAFTLAHSLGIKTCVGTETPLVVPRRIREGMAIKNERFEVMGGEVANYADPIADTEDDALYQNVRYDVDGYRFILPDGRYKVTLKLCEVAYDFAGARVFDVDIDGKRMIESLDIFAKAGKDKALDFVFPNVQVSGGSLSITFPRRTELPSIAAIAVEGSAASVKVNCGGAAYLDYLADDGFATVNKEDIKRLYEGIFTRIMRAYPIDYYWLWTPETWTWEKVKQEAVDATIGDLQLAISAANELKPPFQLATCGWVLGPQQDRALFDKVLPKEMPVSCINRKVGMEPVDKGFIDVKGRPKWAIPWLEDDPALNSAQLWAGRMRRDAADALAYGCTGLMGIHWRTRVLAPNVSALAAAAWDQTAWAGANNPAAPEFRSTGDFYSDWAQVEFGSEVSAEAAAIFAGIDCRLPRPSDWIGGPGGYQPEKRPWEDVNKGYVFVDELTQLRNKVNRAGNKERFDYWLANFRFMRGMAHACCLWTEFNAAMDKVNAADTPEKKKDCARHLALPLRKQLIAAVSEAYRNLLTTVSTEGELGSITNLEQHTLPGLIEKPGAELAAALGEPLPPDAQLPREYDGPTRLIVPTVRSSLAKGESLTVRLVVLSAELPAKANLFWRPLGKGRFHKLPLEHAARGQFQATLERPTEDFEYYCEIPGVEKDKRVVWPPAAPELNQTVVVN